MELVDALMTTLVLLVIIGIGLILATNQRTIEMCQTNNIIIEENLVPNVKGIYWTNGIICMDYNQGIDTMMHEQTHMMIETDYEHFCKETRTINGGIDK